MDDRAALRRRGTAASACGSPADLDQRVLGALAADLGDPFVRETAELYLAELDDRVTAVLRAAAAGTLPELAAAAHTLKSASALLGLARLADLARSVEHTARSGGGVPAEAFRVDREAVRARSALASYLRPGDGAAWASQTMGA